MVIPADGLDKPKDQGIGGTGVMGMLGGDEDFHVNGYQLVLPPKLRLVSDLGPVASLKHGQIVKLTGDERDGMLVPRSLTIEHEVIGPVGDLGDGTGLVHILGQAIDVSQVATQKPPLGRWLAVSGFRDQAGIVHATLLEPAPAGAFKLIGNANELKDFLAQAKATHSQDMAQIKGRMEIRGHVKNGLFAVQSAMAWHYFAGNPTQISLQGYLKVADGEMLDLNKDDIRADDETDVTRLNSAPGEPVIMTGQLQQGQVYRVNSVSAAGNGRNFIEDLMKAALKQLKASEKDQESDGRDLKHLDGEGKDKPDSSNPSKGGEGKGGDGKSGEGKSGEGKGNSKSDGGKGRSN